MKSLEKDLAAELGPDWRNVIELAQLVRDGGLEALVSQLFFNQLPCVLVGADVPGISV